MLVALWVAFARGAADRERFVRYAAACVVRVRRLRQGALAAVPDLARPARRRSSAAAAGIAAIALLVAALVATQAWFPDHYWDYVYDLDRAWLVLLRNLLLRRARSPCSACRHAHELAARSAAVGVALDEHALDADVAGRRLEPRRAGR